MIGARVTAEKARNRLEQLYRDQPDVAFIASGLSQAYAMMGEKDSALKEAERAVMLLPRAKDAHNGPGIEERLAQIQTMCGENSRAISILTNLLATPYDSWNYDPAPITPALLRLDPIWDPFAPIPLSKNSVRKSRSTLPAFAEAPAWQATGNTDWENTELLCKLRRPQSCFFRRQRQFTAASAGSKPCELFARLASLTFRAFVRGSFSRL